MTTLLVIAAVWLVAALIAAFWLGGGMRHAEQGERRRLARERDHDLERRHDRPDEDQRRSA